MTDLPRRVRVLSVLPGALPAVALFAAAGLGGCDTTLPLFVGKPNGGQPLATVTAPPPFTAFATENGFGGMGPGIPTQTILPPTVPGDPLDTAAVEPEPTNPQSGPRKALAVTPLASDAATLAPLAAAAKQAAGGSEARFVLLVLTPPASDAAMIQRTATAAQNAARAAVKAITQTGIAADQIAVSSATNPNVGPGEIRLYQR